MGPDLRHLASTPAPGEGTESSVGSPPQSSSPRQAKSCSPPSSQRSPVAEAGPAKPAQRSPLALHSVSGSSVEPQSAGGGGSGGSPATERPMPKSVSFHDTLSRTSGSPTASPEDLQRSASQRSDVSTRTEGTVIVHDNSGNVAAADLDADEGEADASSTVLRPEPTFAVDQDMDGSMSDCNTLQLKPTARGICSSQDASPGNRVLRAEPTLAIHGGSDDDRPERELRPEPSLAVGRAMPPSPFESMDEDLPAELSTKSPTSVHTNSPDASMPPTPMTPDNTSSDTTLSAEMPPRRCRSAGALPSLGRRPRSPALGSTARTVRKRREGRLSDGGAIALAMGAIGGNAKRQLQFGTSFAGFPNANRTLQDWPTVRLTWAASGTASSAENGPYLTGDGTAVDAGAAASAVPTLQPHIAMSSVFAGVSGTRAGPMSTDGTALAAATPASSDADPGSGIKSRLGPRSSSHSSASSLSHKSARPVGPMPAMHPEPHESESPSLRRSMSTGDEQELREAVRPSLLDWGVPESNIDWIVSKLNIDRRIDRTDTQDKILDGLWGWYTNLAGDKRETAGQDELPAIKPLLRSQTTASEAADADEAGTNSRADADAADERSTPAVSANEAAALTVDTLQEVTAAPYCESVDEATPAPAQPLHRVFGSGALGDGATRGGSRSLASPFATAGPLQSLPVGQPSNVVPTSATALGAGTSTDSTAAPLPALPERSPAGALPPSSSLPAKVMMHSRAVSMVANPSDRTVTLTQPMLKFCIIPSEGIAGMLRSSYFL